MELARRLLDELMGPERNKLPHEKGYFGVRFSDPEVKKLTSCLLLILNYQLSILCIGLQIRSSRVLSISRVHEH